MSVPLAVVRELDTIVQLMQSVGTLMVVLNVYVKRIIMSSLIVKATIQYAKVCKLYDFIIFLALT